MPMKKLICISLLLLVLLCAGAFAETQGAFHSFLQEAQLENKDVCAWLEIPGTQISYPVLQHPQDDAFYLTHNELGQEDANGALYTEAKYNAADFSDPLTVIYGHRMNSGAMFGTLQKEYSGPASFEAHRRVLLHLPDETLEYTVFAAVPYNRVHILHYYDFSWYRVFRLFFDDVFATRSLIAITDAQARPEFGQRVLVLSTCVPGDKSQRFLVMAALDP